MNKLRTEIVRSVQAFCQKHNLDYKSTWRLIYKHYGDRYNIYPHIEYKFGSESKLSYLEDYEQLYKTLTKLKILIDELCLED